MPSSQTYIQIQTPEGARDVPITDKPITIGRHGFPDVTGYSPVESAPHLLAGSVSNPNAHFHGPARPQGDGRGEQERGL